MERGRGGLVVGAKGTTRDRHTPRKSTWKEEDQSILQTKKNWCLRSLLLYFQGPLSQRSKRENCRCKGGGGRYRDTKKKRKSPEKKGGDK